MTDCKNCKMTDEYCASGDCPTSQSPRNHLATKPQTIDLTEKWKKGELPDGWYYCYVYNEEYKKLYYDGDCFELEDPETKNYYFFLPKDSENIIILAQVPSYDEWKASENYIDYLKQCISVYESKEQQHTNDSIAYNEVVEENAQLKEMLKECRKYIEPHIKEGFVDFEVDDIRNCLTKIDEVLR